MTLVAKVAVVAGPVLVAAVLAVAGSLLVARAVLPANGFTPAHGYPALSLGDSATLRASVGTALYLCLIALLSLGVALIVRNTGAAIATALALLFVFPILATLVTEPRWREWLTEWAPMSAGLAVQATRGLDAMPVGPWQGLAVLAAYAGAALAPGRHPARGPRRLTAAEAPQSAVRTARRRARAAGARRTGCGCAR